MQSPFPRNPGGKGLPPYALRAGASKGCPKPLGNSRGLGIPTAHARTTCRDEFIRPYRLTINSATRIRDSNPAPPQTAAPIAPARPTARHPAHTGCSRSPSAPRAKAQTPARTADTGRSRTRGPTDPHAAHPRRPPIARAAPVQLHDHAQQSRSNQGPPRTRKHRARRPHRPLHRVVRPSWPERSHAPPPTRSHAPRGSVDPTLCVERHPDRAPAPNAPPAQRTDLAAGTRSSPTLHPPTRSHAPRGRVDPTLCVERQPDRAPAPNAPPAEHTDLAAGTRSAPTPLPQLAPTLRVGV